MAETHTTTIITSSILGAVFVPLRFLLYTKRSRLFDLEAGESPGSRERQVASFYWRGTKIGRQGEAMGGNSLAFVSFLHCVASEALRARGDDDATIL